MGSDLGKADPLSRRARARLGDNVTLGQRDWHEALDFYAEDAVQPAVFREVGKMAPAEVDRPSSVAVGVVGGHGTWCLGVSWDSPDPCFPKREGFGHFLLWRVRLHKYPETR